MDNIRPKVQEACDNLHGNNENFKILHLIIPSARDFLNRAETDALIAALRANTHVTNMHFVGCHRRSGPENSAFVDFVTETLIPNHPSLEKLVLAKNNITDEVAENIVRALNGRNTRLKGIVFCHNKLSANGVRTLAEGVRHNRYLDCFGLVENRLGSDSCQTIVSSISMKPNFKQFKRLFLGGNRIGVDGGKVIADFILKATSLEFLGLDMNRLGDEGCKHIAKALPKAHSLRDIRLAANNIGDAGCISLADALRNNSTLWELGLMHNVITDTGAAALQATLRHINFSVRALDLSGNGEVTEQQIDQIGHLCIANRRIMRDFHNCNNHLQNIPLALRTKALELVETKPDLLFAMIKAQPELFRERRAQRKRKYPDRLQY